LPEIHRLVGCGYGTVWRYIQEVEVLPEYKEVLRVKQGRSKERSKKNWKDAEDGMRNFLGNFSTRDLVIFMTGIYWGEGAKASLDLINGDPYLIKSFINGLFAIGVKKEDIRLSIRIFSDMDESTTIDFWSSFLGLDKTQVGKSEFVKGNGTKKLQHGMCRVRVLKSSSYFKRVMSMIDLIKALPTPP
jgi:hypothetical protein